MGGGSALLQHSFTLRATTKNDPDDITQIHVEGFTEEPQVHYCYPLWDQRPEDHWKWSRREYNNYLEQSQKFIVYVLEAPSESDGSVVTKPIGRAVWNVAVMTEAIRMGTLRSL